MNRLLSIGLTSIISLMSLSGQTHGTALSPRGIELDGETQYLSVAHHPDLNIPLGQSYTISLWLKGQRTFIYGDPMRLVSKRDWNGTDSLNRSGYELYGLRTSRDSFLGASLPDGAGQYTSSVNGWGGVERNTALGTWHHVALVVDRSLGSIIMYVDGVEIRRDEHNTRAWSATNELPLLIGAGQRSGKTFAHFGGSIDNVRLWRRALGAEEVVRDMQTMQVDPQASGLVAGFDFDDYLSGNTTTRDVTGRFTAQLHGFAPRLEHERVRTFTEQMSNGHLIGRADHQALRVFTLGLDRHERLDSLVVKAQLEGGVLEREVRSLRLYATSRGDRYDHRQPGVLVAQGRTNGSGTITLTPTKHSPQLSSESKLWLVADVSPRATEGARLTTTIERIKLRGAQTAFVPNEPLTTTHEIVLERTLVWTPGEGGSASYRIPAIASLDNGHLVAVIDHRKTTDYDLPSDIDVEVKISRDLGRSWSAPITVAKGTPQHGYGDAALATDGKYLYMVLVGGSGLWFYPSSADKPLSMYFTMSSDSGRSWTPVREISSEVYTDRYPNGGFFGSGNGIITSRGRIAFVAAMRTDSSWGGQMDNVMVYSDDQGKTWHSSPVARSNGDEAKVVELANGDLLISSRNRTGGQSARTWVVSHDHGHTWSQPQVWDELQGQACNVALSRYSRAQAGGKGENILLHTLIEAPRRVNLRIYMSQDEGRSWPVGNTICRGEAAYSEVTRLKDGTVGIISEENDRPAYDIYFTRVSLDWIRRGGANPNLK